MSAPILIKQYSKTPKYIQISESIVENIQSGALKRGAKLPSINQICAENQLARETVVKAFQRLKQKGLIASVQGKGFYISSTNTKILNRVFVLFDTFTSYKETLFYGIKEAFGDNTILDIYFHHFNYEVFKNIIASNIGDYTYYIVLPIDHTKVKQALLSIPSEKLFLLDICPEPLKKTFAGVYQDFKKDVEETLSVIDHQIRKYNSLTLIFRNTVTDLPNALKEGFVNYCKRKNINYFVRYDKADSNLNSGEAYIVIDDDDLVTIVENCRSMKLIPGKDIGIISYNETALKKVVGNGISVISTDFYEMGKGIVQMIKENDRTAIRNKSTFINRGSF